VNTSEPAPPQRVRLTLPLTRPLLVWGLLGINIAMFIVETLLGGSDNRATLVTLGAKVNTLIVMGQYWRLITPMFLHFDLWHIAFNSYALYVLGPEVEAIYGHARFLVIYLLAGVAGNVMSFAFTPALSAGASTAIFGLIGTQVAFFYRQRKVLGAFGQRRLLNIAGIIVINVLFGVTSGAVDNFGHLGGLIGGLVLGWMLCPAYEVEYRADGQPWLADRTVLLREMPGVILFIVLLVVATGAAALQQANGPQVKLEQGIAIFDREDYAGALPLLEQAARELPDDVQAQYLLAADYYNLNRYTDAAQAFENTTRLAPSFPDAHFYLALSYLRLDRRAEALPYLQKYLALDPHGDKADQARQILAQTE
jgi:rhomboid protease GluP